jgi:hypothetical protein
MVITPHQSEFHIPGLREAIAAGPGGGTATGYKVTLKRGNIAGVGASVSGAGAWVKMSGGMKFALQNLESSKTYQEMRSSYSISGGVSGFWSWLGFGANASTHKEEISTALHEMSQSEKVTGHVGVDMMVTGLYPNVQVDASGYVLVMQVTDSQGSVVATVFSTGAPNSDVGAQDSNGNTLPTSSNNNTISI